MEVTPTASAAGPGNRISGGGVEMAKAELVERGKKKSGGALFALAASGEGRRRMSRGVHR